MRVELMRWQIHITNVQISAWWARWSNLLIASVALVLVGNIWLVATRSGTHIGFDFRQYLQGAHTIAAGGNPYHRLVTSGHDSNGAIYSSGYVYPPLFGVLLALPIKLGVSNYVVWLGWSLCNVAVLAWAGDTLNLWLRGKRDIAGTLAFAAALIVPDIAKYDIWLAQTDLFLMALVIVAYGLWLRDNPWASVLMGAAIAIKPTLAILLLLWLWKGDWRTVMRVSAVAATLILVPFLFAGPNALPDYLYFLVHWKAFGSEADVINQSPYGMLLRLFTANPVTQPLIIASWLVLPLRVLISGGVLAWWLRAVPRRATPDKTIAFAECLLTLPLVVLLSPLAEDIHFCIILPALMGFAWLALTQHAWWQPTTWILWATALFTLIPHSMQDLIWPARAPLLPGQGDPYLGQFIVLLRTGTLLWIALATFFAASRLIDKMRERAQLLPISSDTGRASLSAKSVTPVYASLGAQHTVIIQDAFPLNDTITTYYPNDGVEMQ